MNNYKLYVHITPNGKRYYGITKQKPRQRWGRGSGYKGQVFYNAVQKYGWDNIQHEILFDGLTEHEAKELEQYMIQWYDTTNKKYGYNTTTGGEGTKGMYSEKNSFYGRHHTEENKQLYRERNSGLNNEKSKSVICLTTKRIFFSTREAAKYYDIKSNSSICACCKGKKGKKKCKSAGRLPDGTPIVWRYLNHKHNKTYRIAEGCGLKLCMI